MDKTRINLNMLLPELPNERDACVKRIIEALEYKRGIDKVHVVPGTGDEKAQLCFHYDPARISINEVELLAKQAGAEITERYGHLLLEALGIRHPRHARLIEAAVRAKKGVQSVSVSGTGFIELEYDKQAATEEAIIDAVNRTGLKIQSVEDFHRHEEKPAAGAEQPSDHHHDGHRHDGHTHGPGHSHASGIFGEKTELIFAIICGALLGTGFGLSFIEGSSISLGFYIGAYFFGGFFTTKEAVEGISKGEFEIDFLMLVAAAGAAVLGQWAEGALLLFLFSLGHSLEHYAMERARKSIAALSDLAPKTALVKSGEGMREVAISELKKDDIIIVKPNSKIAADGVVVAGAGAVNQAPITGESIPVDKMPIDGKDAGSPEKLDARYRVFAGSINGAGSLEVKVTKLAADSTIARLVKLVNEAQTQKSPTQNFTDRLEKYYVPAVLLLVVALLFAFVVVDEPFRQSFYRAMAVLVAASPCALAISTPSAVLSGVARAARSGVLVKGGRPLEELGALTAIAFDKTGTLTEGRPTLTGVYGINGFLEEDLLAIVIAVEQLSDHPLAAALVKRGLEKLKRAVPPASGLETVIGRGVKATHNGKLIQIGNKELFSGNLPQEIKTKIEALEAEGNTTMLVKQDDAYIGMITLMDVPRKEAKDTLAQLSRQGIRKMVMLTGDNQQVADAIARQIGLTEALGNLLPEQKIEALEKLKATEAKIAMVGDGVNDAPAMAKSTVGIAMGAAGSDVALETADIALMADGLNPLPFAIGLSKKAHRIIRQNLLISLGMVVVLIPLTLLGIAHIGPAVIGHEGSTLLVVFNALRLLAYKSGQ